MSERFHCCHGRERRRKTSALIDMLELMRLPPWLEQPTITGTPTILVIRVVSDWRRELSGGRRDTTWLRI